MYQSGRAGDEAKKPKSPAKSGRVGITALDGGLHFHNWSDYNGVTFVNRVQNGKILG